MHGVRRHLTYANIAATLALVVALSGTSYAATLITGKQIKDGSVHVVDLAPNAKTKAWETYHDAAIDISTSTQLLHLDVPKGDYVINAKTILSDSTTKQAFGVCTLTAGVDFDTSNQGSGVTTWTFSRQSVVMQVVHQFSAPGTITLECNASGEPVTALNSKITAVRVARLTEIKG